MKKVIIGLIVVFLIILLIDVISFQEAVNILRTDLSTKGFDTPITMPSYRPFIWGRPVAGITYRSMGNDELEKPFYVRFRIGEHQAVTVLTNGNNWFEYKVPQNNDTKNEWYKQEYGSITGYVKILSHQEYYDENYNKVSRAKILYYFETDTQKTYFAVQNITLKRGGCDGGYWYGEVGTTY
jgi:hypothetical protein